jgi:hypothetical protein
MTATPFPEKLVETPFGTLKMWATSDRHVGFATSGNLNVPKVEGEADKVIVINKVEYTFRVDFHPADDEQVTKRPEYQRIPSGSAWQTTHYEGINMRRRDWMTVAKSYPSNAAYQKMTKVLLPFLIAFIESPEGQEVVRAAAMKRANDELEGARIAVQHAREALAAAEAKLAEMEGR